MMTLGEYESYLDTIDGDLQQQGDQITLTFSKPFNIALSECKTDAGLAAQLRHAMLRLLDDNLPMDYVAQRIVKLARPDWGHAESSQNARKFYLPHRILFLCDVVRSPQAPLRFENSIGKYAGAHWLDLQRMVNQSTGTPAPAVQVIRPVFRFPDHPRTANVKAVELSVDATHLVFSFDSSTAWTNAPGVEYDTISPPTESRFALRHLMSKDEVARVVDDTRAMFEGLDFKFSVIE